MAEEPIRVYSKANGELDQANNDLDKIRSLIQHVGQQLAVNPLSFSVSNAGVDFPAEVIMSHNPSLNANDWPSAKQIGEVLSNLHTKRKAVEDVWRRLSIEDKKIVRPPEWLRGK